MLDDGRPASSGFYHQLLCRVKDCWQEDRLYLGLLMYFEAYYASAATCEKELLVVYLVIATTIAQNIVFYGNSRFRAPIEPLLVLMAGGAIWWLISHFSSAFRNPKHGQSGAEGVGQLDQLC